MGLTGARARARPARRTVGSLANLDQIVASIEKELDEADRVREQALRRSRDITRRSGAAIRAILHGANARKDLEMLRRDTRALRTLVRRHPQFVHGGPVEIALQEAAEAAIVSSVVAGSRLPSPGALGVTGAAYVLGLADAIGEFRRIALDRMRVGQIQDADRFVVAMEELFHAISRFGYPDAIVAVRHKQDVARGLVERTRGELAVAARSAEIERHLASFVKRR